MSVKYQVFKTMMESAAGYSARFHNSKTKFWNSWMKSEVLEILNKNLKGTIAIRRIFSVVATITKTEFSNCFECFATCVVRQ